MQMYSCIQPVYVKDFRCDGSLCHSKCCRGWQIEIDAETYRKYKKLPAGELRSRVLTKLARRANGMYRFAMEGISCPMLCEDGLCAIQRQFGEDFLSNTCAEFPRRVHVLQDGIAERVLSFACPVAARLAMENPAAMAFEQVALSTSRAAGFLPLPRWLQQKQELLLSLQMGGITILQDRLYPLSERCRRLYTYVATAEKLYVSGCGADIDRIRLEDGESTLPVALNRQGYFRFMFGLLDALYGKAIVLASDDDINYVPFIVESFGLQKQSCTFAELESAYQNAWGIYVKQVLEPYGYMLEHYLVQEYFSNLYPFKLDESMKYNMLIFFILYRFMELTLMSMAAVKKELTKEDIVGVFVRMAQRTDHAGMYVQIIEQQLAGHMPDDMIAEILI